MPGREYAKPVYPPPSACAGRGNELAADREEEVVIDWGEHWAISSFRDDQA